MIIEQTYPGIDDVKKHFYALLEAFQDKRYIKINGKNLFAIFCPDRLENSKIFMETWRELASKEDAPDFYFVAIQNSPLSSWNLDYDAFTTNPPCAFRHLQKKIEKIIFNGRKYELRPEGPNVFSYKEYVERVFPAPFMDENSFPCVVPNWDNTPRTKNNGFVYVGSTPALYKRHLQKAVDFIDSRDEEEKIIFIKSWNEWAEGNYLEPDCIHGLKYLEATLSAVL